MHTWPDLADAFLESRYHHKATPIRPDRLNPINSVGIGDIVQTQVEIVWYGLAMPTHN